MTYCLLDALTAAGTTIADSFSQSTQRRYQVQNATISNGLRRRTWVCIESSMCSSTAV